MWSVIKSEHLAIGKFALLMLFLSSCNIYKEVRVSEDKGTDYNNYQTYAWLWSGDSTSIEKTDDFIRMKTRNYFAHCMNQRRLTLDTINPDLLLKVEWLSDTQEVTLTGPRGLPEYYDPIYYDQYAPFYFLGGPNRREKWNNSYGEHKVKYTHGGAKLTVFDRESKKIIWSGVAQGNLYDPNIMYTDLHPAVHKLMKKFPIKP